MLWWCVAHVHLYYSCCTFNNAGACTTARKRCHLTLKWESSVDAAQGRRTLASSARPWAKQVGHDQYLSITFRYSLITVSIKANWLNSHPLSICYVCCVAGPKLAASSVSLRTKLAHAKNGDMEPSCPCGIATSVIRNIAAVTG